MQLSADEIEHIDRWATEATPSQVAAAMREKLRLEKAVAPGSSTSSGGNRKLWHCPDCDWRGRCRDLSRSADEMDPACPTCGCIELDAPEEWDPDVTFGFDAGSERGGFVPVAKAAGFLNDGTPTVEWTGDVATGDVLYRRYETRADAAPTESERAENAVLVKLEQAYKAVRRAAHGSPDTDELFMAQDGLADLIRWAGKGRGLRNVTREDVDELKRAANLLRDNLLASNAGKVDEVADRISAALDDGGEDG